ncbi:MAG: DUF402 domain-containing protein [Erysipelotrichaceae bacterium]|nr:DUF402 domain-containing protein [Erysipelotrichaceae bacterium]
MQHQCYNDGEALKNIDLDLDVKVFPDGTHTILDEDEFELHQLAMDYSQDVIDISKAALNQIIELIKHNKEPFNKQTVYEYLDQYTKNHKVST